MEKKVWIRTKEIVLNGNIVTEIKKNKSGKEIRLTNFPDKKFSSISHVRPHATNALDTFPLPVMDVLTKKMNTQNIASG